MLTEHEKWKLGDGFFCEVNWNPENELTNNCQVFKFTLPNDEVFYVERKHLLEILFACGKSEDQQKMIPQTLETIHHYKTILGIKATKDIGKGEMMNFPVELSVPCSALRQDFISALPKEYRNGKFGGLSNV